MKTPFKLNSKAKQCLWGGTRLLENFNKQTTYSTMGESWELSCHSDGLNRMMNGEHEGELLRDVVMGNPSDYLGVRYQGDEFPILVKLIDAEKALSVQVHPSNDCAHRHLGERGKAEMWYILDAKPDSHIYYGLNRRTTPDELRRYAEAGTICELLNCVSVKRGDIFYIPPGMIHAIGAGVVVAEIQQSSNTTFRLYDYNRLDSDGNPRTLHLERGIQVVDYTPTVPTGLGRNNQTTLPDVTVTQMIDCPYFSSYRIQNRGKSSFYCSDNSFHHLLFVSGEGMLRWNSGEMQVKKGDSCFLPAGMGGYEIEGQCIALLSKLSEER